MTPALQAELWRHLEHAVAVLDEDFWGEIVLRVQGGKLRVVDVNRRLKRIEMGGAQRAGVTSEETR